MRTGDAGDATRPVVVLSGLGATAARVLPPLARRGRVAVVAKKGMAITASMLRDGCTGMGILVERVGHALRSLGGEGRGGLGDSNRRLVEEL